MLPLQLLCPIRLVPVTVILPSRARKVAWTAAAVGGLSVGILGLLVALVPHVWSGLFTTDPHVRAAANLYLHWAGPFFGIFAVGLALYFASQGSGKMLNPVLAATVRLSVIALGSWWLASIGAEAWAVFALVSVSMVAYGLATIAAVYFTPWGSTPRLAQ